MMYYEMDRYSMVNGTQFNEAVCGLSYAHVDMHREGRFCGRCKEGYGLAAYSYHYTSCISCTDYGYTNWLLYFTVALLPLTVFYFFVVILKLNVTSSRFGGVVFMLQCAMSLGQLRVFDGWVKINQRSYFYIIVFKMFTSVYGSVNLDFFRAIYPYFCMHPKLNILHVTSLDFVIALYPFFLIFRTYVLINMYDNNYRLVVGAWRPFKLCLSRVRKKQNTKASLIETFATFILLSNVKILGVCFDLVAVTRVWDPAGTKVSKSYVLYDANIEYFGDQHLPFALLALVMGFVFVIIPFLLLVLYPCHCFQRILNFLGLNCQSLRIFMDAFQGSYKTKPRDLRQFSALFLVLRFLLLLSMTVFTSTFYVVFNAFVLISSGMLFALFQPYRNKHHNMLDIASILLLSLLYVGLAAFFLGAYLDLHWLPFGRAIFTISVLGMVVQTLVVTFYRCKFLKVVRKVFRRAPRDEEIAVLFSESLDRNLHSTNTPLLSPNEQTPLINSR